MKDISGYIFTYHQVKINQEQFESFYKNLIDALSVITKQQQISSILVCDFSNKLSKWCPSDKDNNKNWAR